MSQYLDIILDYYKNIPNSQIQRSIDFDNFTITNPNTGIGDSLTVFLLDKQIDQKNISVIVKHPSIVQDLYNFNTFISSINNRYNHYYSLFSVWDIQVYSKFGGHFLQKIQQFLNLPIDIKPRPKLSSNIPVIKNKVVMTFDKGVVNQTHIHPRARIIYEETKNIIQKFIDDHSHIYEFVEVGKHSLGLNNINNRTNIGIKNTAEEIASCDYFFGNHNGLMHIAAGLNKKSIIIINFPHASEVVLPCLKKVNTPDADWLYPQNIHLHQDNEGPLVKQISYDNIKKAFNHELYPFFSEQYLLETFNHVQ